MATVSYRTLQREIVKAIRRGRSQQQLSKRLGYKSNEVHKWEQSTRNIAWSKFVEFARLCRVDMKSALQLGAFYDGDPTSAAGLVAHVMGSTPLLEFSSVCGVSRHRVGRWLNGRAEPTLGDVLSMLDRAALRLVDFVDTLAGGVAHVPSLQAQAARIQAQRELTVTNPGVSSLALALELDRYRSLPRHSDALLAEITGKSLDETRRCLRQLVAVGAVAKRRGKYELTEESKRINLVLDAASRLVGVRHWTEHLATLMERMPVHESDRITFQVLSVSAAAKAKIQRCCTDYAAAIRNITGHDDQPKDQLLVLTMLCYDPAGPQEASRGARASSRAP
jgi:transcriptional regulator with XRE-family HTH domain